MDIAGYAGLWTSKRDCSVQGFVFVNHYIDPTGTVQVVSEEVAGGRKEEVDSYLRRLGIENPRYIGPATFDENVAAMLSQTASVLEETLTSLSSTLGEDTASLDRGNESAATVEAQ